MTHDSTTTQEHITGIDTIQQEYKHRYDNPSEDIEARKQLYPHFMDFDDIAKQLEVSTTFPLVTKKPWSDYGQDEPIVQLLNVHLPAQELRSYFSGTNEDMEEANNTKIDSNYGIQLTDDRLIIPVDVKETYLHDATQKAINGKVGVLANSEAWWLNKNWKVDQDIAEARLSEVYNLKLGDSEIQLVNLDKPLDTDTVAGIGEVIEKIARATDGRIFSRLKTLILQHYDRFPPAVFGEALGTTGVFRLNTAIIELDHILVRNGNQHEYGKEFAYWQGTLAHEIGHMMDISDLSDNEAFAKLKEIEDDEAKATHFRSAFGPLLGWRHKAKEVNSDGQTKKHVIKGIETPPEETLVLSDGKITKVNTLKYFGEAAISGASPISSYGSLREEEDFAEAFGAYVLDGPEAVDPLRKAALELTFSSLIDSQTAEISPTEHIKIVKQDLSKLETKLTTPKTIPVAVFLYCGMWTKAPDFVTLINPPTDEELAKQGRYK